VLRRVSRRIISDCIRPGLSVSLRLGEDLAVDEHDRPLVARTVNQVCTANSRIAFAGGGCGRPAQTSLPLRGRPGSWDGGNVNYRRARRGLTQSRDSGRVVRTPLVLAYGVQETVSREVIGVDVGEAETEVLVPIVDAAAMGAYSIYTFAATESNAMMPTLPYVVFGLFRYLYVARRSDRIEEPERILLADRPILLTVAPLTATAATILE
jgi:hypothetical protein